jgi:uncharacterized protein YdhG (YjbR/CyaY superfamily)
MAKRSDFKSVDEYIATFPKDLRIVLSTIRKTIKKELPDAEETISYQIPCFKQNGKYVIYFAGFKNHISLYPIPDGDSSFKKEIAPYVAGKGTLKFPLDKPLPLPLINKVVRHSLKANQARTKNLRAW